MSRYSIVVAPVLSLVSADFYRDVGQNWRFKAFFYLFLLTAASWIPFCMKFSVEARAAVEKEGREFTDQIPPISIRNGKAVVNAPQPVMIRAGDPKEVVAIIDTTGKIKSLEGTTAKFLLTEKYMIIDNNQKIEQRDLKEIDTFDIDGPTAQKWVEWGAGWIPIIFYPFILIFSFIGWIILVLLCSLAGLLLKAIFGAKVSYGGVLSVCIMALTAPILMGTVTDVAPIQIPFYGLIKFGVAIAYIAFGMSANAAHREPTDVFQPPTM